MSDKTRKVFFPIAIIIFGIVLTYVLVVAYPEAEQMPSEVFKPLVRYEVAKKSDAAIYIKSQGTVVPRTESNIISQVAGQIISTSARFTSGGFFNKGEIMVSIDPADYKLAKTSAELQVAQAQLRLAREEEEALLAKEEWSKMGDGNASDLVLRKPQLNEARASLAAAKALLEQANLNLNRTEIKAPYDCIVRRKMADVGQVVNMGLAIANIYAIDYVEVRLPLTDEDLAFIDIPFQYSSGTAAKPFVQLSALFAGKKHTWQGKLVRLEGEVDPRNRMINGIARVEDPYGKFTQKDTPPLSVGMFVTAEIEGEVLKDVYEIDRSALRGEHTIWIIDQDNKLHLREVKIKRLEEEKVIVENGIEENDKICLTALDAVVDGMEVNLGN